MPALSSRDSTTQTRFEATGADPDGPLAYHREISRQRFLLGVENGAGVIGFLSYRDDFVLPRDDSLHEGSTFYVTTVFVDPDYRRRGITTSLYRDLIRRAEIAGRSVSTRTWSLNDGHLALLARLGFHEVRRIVDDRGEGIDTVYLERPASLAGASSTGTAS